MVAEQKFSDILAKITDRDLEVADLNNCDREPIHIPNLIQPHGILIAVEEDSYRILQVSLNTKTELGIEPEALLNKPLEELLGKEQVKAIQGYLAEDFDHANPLPIKLECDGKVLSFEGIVHRDGLIVIVELEFSTPRQQADFFNFYQLVKNPINKIQQTQTLEELCQVVVQEVKAITNFDRVMVYRFDSYGAGKVIAEAAEAELTPYLGLQYPDTDIPRQAKYLFTLKSLRLIPDVAYEPVEIIPELNPLTNKRLDMSLGVLRSVSPYHIEYLKNMGVSATLVVSLVKNKKLWGLISCHHLSAKKVSYEVRTVCEFIGQIVSFELAAKEENQDMDYKIRLKSLQSRFMAAISQENNLEESLTYNSTQLLDLVGATGAALSFGEKITLVGKTPQKKEVACLSNWLESQFNGNLVYETNSLSQTYKLPVQDRQLASGLLAIPVSRIQKNYLIWFRSEVIQTVNWAGNPHQPLERDEDGTLLLSPRASFALWKETIKDKSLPWKSCEIEAALELRNAIVGIVLQKADQLAQVNKELARSNIELDAFAYIASHDLKEPLRGIYNYSSFLIEDYGETLGDDGRDKLDTLMRLTHRMEDLINSLLHYSRLGRAELQRKPTDLNNLVAGVLDVIKASARDTQVEFKIPRPLPTINCDRTQVNELFTNLISNGIKYNQKAQKIVEIGYLNPEDSIVQAKALEYPESKEISTVFYVRDNGIGIREKHLESIFRIFKRLHGQKKYGGGTGAGLTIAKKIVERHGGEIWVKSVYREGTTFYFTLP